jgi:hypothetical protein
MLWNGGKRSYTVVYPILLLLLVGAVVSSFQPASLACERRSLTTSHSNSIEGEGGEEEEPGRRARKKLEKKQDYERRRTLWLQRYGTFEALQSTFGAGPIWGDLNAEETRRLYHTLLPRSLLGLHEMGLMKPEELAPLAYEARIAAKEYARSRCVWTGRLVTAAFDQYRNLRDRGRFSSQSSMTWDEIWQKYEAQIVEEECAEALLNADTPRRRKTEDETTLTMRIYLRILERSCATNQAFDSLFLKEGEDDSDDLAEIASTLENDVRAVLLRPKENADLMRKQQKANEKEEKEEKELRKVEEKDEKEQRKMKEKEEKRKRDREENEQEKDQKKKQKSEDKKEKRKRDREENEQEVFVTSTAVNNAAVLKNATVSSVSSQRYEVLRILAGTRRKFRQMRGDTT